MSLTLIKIIKFYKKHISKKIKKNCIYYPTCSSYSIEAIKKYGVVRGVLLSIYRIIRCNPFSNGGYDPVP